MKNKDELKKIDLKNRRCYHFDDIVKARNRDIDFTDILLDEKLYKENHEKYFDLLDFIQNFNGCKTIAY